MCEAADEVAQVSRDRWPSCLAVWPRPLSGNEIAVPSQQRVGRDDEAAPPVSAQHAAGSGEEYTIGRPVRRPRRLASKNRELLAEDEDLDVLGVITAPREERELEQSEQAHVDG